MFLGVRPASDWNRAIGGNTFDFLCRVRGNEQNCPNAQNEAQLPGVWPAVVVVLSNEVFNVVRSTERPCTIAGVNSEGRGHIYEYLAQASQRGIPIIIRLASPGNFRDAVELGPPHTLILAPSETPQIGGRNRTYCDADREGRDGDSGYKSFRSIDDLLNEMGAILGLLDVDDRFNLDNIYFLPANEPNGEWYGPGWWTWQALYNESPGDLPEAVRAELPQRQFEVNTEGIGAWDDMNRFFSALYRRKEERARNEPGSAFPLINILTPPIGQGQRAEPFRQNCADQLLFPAPNQTRVVESGYERMLLDYADTLDVQEGMLQPALNDGYSWNNYWNPDATREQWSVNGLTGCQPDANGNRPAQPHTVHISQLFPDEMQVHIENNDSFIIEADLLSPNEPQGGTLPASSKDAFGNFGIGTARSLARFVRAEAEGSYGADFVSLWLLTIDFNEAVDQPDRDPRIITCTQLDNGNNFPENQDLRWHQAYLPNGTECNWFRSLWQRPE
jgi:hypothetical protein